MLERGSEKFFAQPRATAGEHVYWALWESDFIGMHAVQEELRLFNPKMSQRIHAKRNHGISFSKITALMPAIANFLIQARFHFGKGRLLGHAACAEKKHQATGNHSCGLDESNPDGAPRPKTNSSTDQPENHSAKKMRISGK